MSDSVTAPLPQPAHEASAASRRALWMEWALAFGVLLVMVRGVWLFTIERYLPQPFLYDPGDTYMDWFNTAYWAYDTGTYDVWGSIYPPISFVFLRLFSFGDCYKGNHQGPDNYETWVVRSCDWIGIVAIHVFYIIAMILIARIYMKVDRKTSFPRAFALSAGMPMLFALERGNLLIVCLIFFMLGFGPLIRSARLRWVFAGLAINFKIYLMIAIFTKLLRRKWIWFEGALIATVVVYALAYLALGRGSPGDVFGNIFGYTAAMTTGDVILWYQVTYQALLTYLSGQSVPILMYMGSNTVETIIPLISGFVIFGQASMVLGMIACWIRPEAVSDYRATILGVCLALMSVEVGGYCEIFLIYLLFMEKWSGFARIFAITCGYLLCMPGDIVFDPVPYITRFSYLGSKQVEMHYGIAVGMVMRPALVILIGVALSFSTIGDVWRDIREEGWKGRWRFRRDSPLLPGVERPIAPARLPLAPVPAGPAAFHD